jgi:hypothetical protein
MATLPTKTKTWQYNNNQAVGNTGVILNDYRNIMRAIKTSLIGFGTLPWAVSGSSDGSTSGMDATDRWDADTDLVWNNAGSAHSWIVLRQTGVAAQFEVCFDLNNSNHLNATVVVSSVGFGTANAGTNGSTTARPTATDEVVILNNASWASGTNTAQEHRLHVQQSTDGQCTRIFLSKNQVFYLTAILDKPKNPITQWTTPWVATWSAVAITSPAATVAILNDGNSRTFFKATNSLISGNLYLGGLFIVSSMVTERAAGQVPQDVQGGRAFLPITLMTDTPLLRGCWGEMFDLYWTDNTLVKATQFDASPSRAWTYIEHLVIPWDGTTQITA